VTQSDFIVLDSRFPSFGAGQELEIAANGGIPVVLLKPRGADISRMVTGTFARLFIVEFASAEDLAARLHAEFTALVAELANLYRGETYSFRHTEEDETFGQRLKRIRSQMRLDESTVARLVGVATHAIEQFEKDLGNPSTTQLHRLAAVLQTSVAHLVEGVATRPEETNPVLRKSKDTLRSFALGSNVSLQQSEQLWQEYVEKYMSARMNVAEARSEPLTEAEWSRRFAALKNGGKSGAQGGLFTDV
jgi:transcriptional regulator with XRE-family HTH domain